MGKTRVLLEFLQFLRDQKKFWLIPIVVILGLFGLLLIITQHSVVAPFVYTLF